MSDSPQTPPAAPTDGGTGVNPTPGTPAVNPGQAPQGQNPADISGLIASYEQRIRNLMSEKDKALHERNQAISQLAELQNTYTAAQEQTANSLTNTANAAQAAINQNKTFEVTIAQLQSELLRAKTLLAEPDLAAYEQFIPATSDPVALQAAVDQLKKIRTQDIERFRAAGQLPPSTQPGVPAAQGVPSTPPGQPSVMNLYANRPSIAPQVFAPASSPAAMNPQGSGEPLTNIQDILHEAINSGDSTKYQQALDQAKLLATPLIQQQMGR